MIKHNCEQRSELWYSLRCGKVTGTRFKDLMAAKTTAAYRNLIADMCCEIITDETEGSDYVSEAMQNGIDTEPEARVCYEELKNCIIEQVGFITPEKTENKFYDIIGISPDGLTEDEGMIEIKCPKRSTHLYYINNNKLPSEYKWQVHGQLYVTKLNYCDFFSYCKGLKPFIIRVLPDKEIFSQIEIELEILVTEIKNLLQKYNKY